VGIVSSLLLSVLLFSSNLIEATHAFNPRGFDDGMVRGVRVCPARWRFAKDPYSTAMTDIVRLLRSVLPKKYLPTMYLREFVDARSRGKVIGGPFAGLNYVAESVSSVFYPKILGTYEIELLSIVLEILASDVQTVVDIGAAEGYYACGFSKTLPLIKVVAFEADLKGRYLLDRNIALNHLEDRVTTRGFCDASSLNQELRAARFPALIVCDVEGNEYDVLRPDCVEQLSHCMILVELHEFVLPGITEVMKERFSKTHRLIEIHTKQRLREDFPFWNQNWLIRRLPFKYIHNLLDELRPGPMNWLYMKPLAG
jgi:predicted O-methyltransferase YrrM